MFLQHGVETWSAAKVSVGDGFMAMIVALLVFVQVTPNTWQINERLRPRLAYSALAGVAAGIVILSLAEPTTFLYFQF